MIGRSDVRPLSWYPGLVVLRFQFYLAISDKQLKLVLPFWDILKCKLCVVPEMSAMGVSWREAPHDRGIDLENDERQRQASH